MDDLMHLVKSGLGVIFDDCEKVRMITRIVVCLDKCDLERLS